MCYTNEITCASCPNKAISIVLCQEESLEHINQLQIDDDPHHTIIVRKYEDRYKSWICRDCNGTNTKLRIAGTALCVSTITLAFNSFYTYTSNGQSVPLSTNILTTITTFGGAICIAIYNNK